VSERASGCEETSSVGGASGGGSANNLDWRRRVAAGDSLVAAICSDAEDGPKIKVNARVHFSAVDLSSI
jgi:hypothetical protein